MLPKEEGKLGTMLHKRTTGNQTRRVKFTFCIAHRFPTLSIFLKKKNSSHNILYSLPLLLIAYNLTHLPLSTSERLLTYYAPINVKPEGGGGQGIGGGFDCLCCPWGRAFD